MSETKLKTKESGTHFEEEESDEEESVVKPPAKRPRPPESTEKPTEKKGDEEEWYGEEEEEDYKQFVEWDFAGCTSEELLNKRTRSFTCFAQVVLSSSSILRNLAYVFPVLKDPGIDDAFNYVEIDPAYDDIGVEKYMNLCKDFEIIPLTRIKSTLGTPLMNLKFYGLREKQLKAIMETLKGNHYVEKLILQDNFMTPQMTEMICKMIEENGTLRTLSLKQCNIGAKGAALLNESLSTSQFLTDLNLSFNNLGDVGMKSLQQGLCDMPSLRILDISNNKLTEDSAIVLEKIILDNKNVSELNLAWNGFYTVTGNKLIFKALRCTDRLRVLNLCFNGINVKAASTWLARYIRKSEVLEELDLSWNRFEEASLNIIRSALLNNSSLVTIKLGSIPCSPEKAYFVACILTSPKKTAHPLKNLDMANIYFNKEIIKVGDKTVKSVCKAVDGYKHFTKFGFSDNSNKCTLEPPYYYKIPTPTFNYIAEFF